MTVQGPCTGKEGWRLGFMKTSCPCHRTRLSSALPHGSYRKYRLAQYGEQQELLTAACHSDAMRTKEISVPGHF